MDMNTPQGINTNTYVSLGLVVVVIAASIWINTSVSDAKASVNEAKISVNTATTQITKEVNDLTKRMDKYESSKETWSFHDMFKWAVHLQRDNPPMKIPEPEPRQ